MEERALIERFQRIEAYLRDLGSHVGLPYPDPADDVPAEVRQLVASGKRINAVKRYMELTGTDMRDATNVVNQL